MRVTVATELAQKVKKTNGRWFNGYTREHVIEKLRVVFDVEKNLEQDANGATIKIHNLSEKSRGVLARIPAHMHLEAGYDDNLHTIYKGDITSASSKREGPNWVTTIKCGTGANAKHAIANTTFKSNVNTKTVITDMAKTMGLHIPKSIADAKGMLKSITNEGIVLQGPALPQMNKVLGPRGYKASIQDDALVIVKRGGVRMAEAVLVAQRTGMIGSPELSSPDDSKSKPNVKAKMLIAPDIVAGGLIKIESLRISGTYGVDKVRHIGDTHGAAWYSELEGFPV